MKPRINILIVTALLLCGHFPIMVSKEEYKAANGDITIWSAADGGVPGIIKPHDASVERGEEIDGSTKADGIHIRAVHIPTMVHYPFVPKDSSVPTAAVVICPGGGYAKLAYEKEGVMVAKMFSRIGVSSFILKYRHQPYSYPASLQDALQAIRYVRAHAEEYKIDKEKIGIVGFSAGGHLAACVATLYSDAVGQVGSLLSTSAKPNFVVLIYPLITMNDRYTHEGSKKALFGDDPPEDLLKKLSPNLNVNSATPPMFLVHTGKDESVPVQNSLMMYQALQEKGRPAELHVFSDGPHGLGLGQVTKHADYSESAYAMVREWPPLVEKWLRGLDVIG